MVVVAVAADNSDSDCCYYLHTKGDYCWCGVYVPSFALIPFDDDAALHSLDCEFEDKDKEEGGDEDL